MLPRQSNYQYISLDISDSAWLQVTLTICCGGLDLCTDVQLTPSTFLSSAAALSTLFAQILPQTTPIPTPSYSEALSEWSKGLSGPSSSQDDDVKLQTVWDFPHIEKSVSSLVAYANDDITHARLHAVSTPESGAWLHACSHKLPLRNWVLLVQHPSSS